MRFHGQRWRFDVGNHVIKIDNAYNWSLWGQERMILNGEQVRVSGGWLRIFGRYTEPWLTLLGEEELRVTLSGAGSGVQGIACRARIGDEPLVPTGVWTAGWSGDRWSWPEEEAWIAVDAAEWRGG